MQENKHQWKKALLPLGGQIRDAIQNLEKSGTQIVLFIDKNNRLVGTLTDGDIRRAFLNGANLETSIHEIINRDPFTVSQDTSQKDILNLMKIKKIHQLPVVDDERKVLKLELLEQIITPTINENIMVIMAGGKGSRMYPYTKNCPKPMLKIRGKPILEHIIEKSKKEGILNFIISINHLGYVIEDYFKDGKKFGVNISYCKETKPLGTAGALSLISDNIELPLIICNGDVLANISYHDMLNFHKKNRSMATMAVRLHEIQNPYGIVTTKGIEIDSFEEKPIYSSYVNAGIYIINPLALKTLKYDQFCDMPNFFSKLKLNDEKTIVYPMYEKWLDVGQPNDLITAQKFLK